MHYEYDVVWSEQTGKQLKTCLNDYAKRGWRIVSILNSKSTSLNMIVLEKEIKEGG